MAEIVKIMAVAAEDIQMGAVVVVDIATSRVRNATMRDLEPPKHLWKFPDETI